MAAMHPRVKRQRREYIYKRSIEDRERTQQEKRRQIKNAVENNKDIPTHLRGEAIGIEKTLEWEGEGGEGIVTNEDDEYKWAGCEDPKVMITTSHKPSSRLKMFAKEMRLIFPNAQRINRGGYDVQQLVDACRANNVSDLILLTETRGNPDGMIVSHLPYGPTAYFTLYNTVMRHDIPDKKTVSEVYPHLIFNNFTSTLGQRAVNILKYLFPVPKEDSKRVMTFANEEDFVSFRHHLYKKIDGKVELTEQGPRFEMKLYQIVRGTLENIDSADKEYVYRPYMRTTKKRSFLTT